MKTADESTVTMAGKAPVCGVPATPMNRQLRYPGVFQRWTVAMIHENILSKLSVGRGGFTLIELCVCLAMLATLTVLAVPVHVRSIEKAKAVEATIALAEIVRLEALHYTDKGTYAADLEDLGFHMDSSLEYIEVAIQVRKDATGWSYMAFAMPRAGTSSDPGGWAVGQYPGGHLALASSGSLKSGVTSPCSIWAGWGSMEGGRIEGEERLGAGSSASGIAPCAGVRVVSQGKK